MNPELSGLGIASRVSSFGGHELPVVESVAAVDREEAAPHLLVCLAPVSRRVHRQKYLRRAVRRSEVRASKLGERAKRLTPNRRPLPPRAPSGVSGGVGGVGV